MKVLTGMCSDDRFRKSPTITVGVSPPFALLYRDSQASVRLCWMSALATSRESVSFHSPDRSVTVSGSIRETFLLLQPAAARATRRNTTATVRGRDIIDLPPLGPAGELRDAGALGPVA